LSALERLAKTLLLFASLSQIHAQEAQQLSQQDLNLSSAQADAMSLVIDYILKNSEQTISVNDMLELTALSRATFHRQFKKTTGSTLGVYLNAVRLQEARRLLIQTSSSVTSIAFDTGFHNLSHFNALFKRRFLMSPRELRKQFLKTKS